VRKALQQGAELLIIWGGDGMVQRCLDASVGSDVPVAIIPAGTANLFAHNLGIPHDLPEAVRIAFGGARRRLDLGRFNGEHFAVMAGIGFDANMIEKADGRLKNRLGRLAYIWTSLHEVSEPPARVRIKIDGTTWFSGPATCVLVGNVGTVFGGVTLFDDARPDDGWLDVGVTTARGAAEWARAMARVSTGPSDMSPFIRITRGQRISVKLRKPLIYELDGGARGKTDRVKVRVVPSCVSVCVPADNPAP
jgi:YegS/Rv2252/BmrU family lipid kinase